MDIVNPRARFMKIKNDPYLNAVQVKFAYALTCHKMQGGQWKHVLIDQSYIPDGILDKEYFVKLISGFGGANAAALFKKGGAK